ncbi:MAG: TrkH family potassium uptake protein [Bacteroidales bacterium]|nr:TrkH family potassium uptake protein [Bacteroidales bacterium]
MASSIKPKSIIRVIGRLVLIEALLLLVPMVVCLIYGESEWRGFALSAVAAGIAGGVAEAFTVRSPATIHAREGFIITSVIWIVFTLFGIIPFMLSRQPLNFTDAVFEVISGLTTTGASMITDVEAQSHGILFWRAFTQWIGGLGIILFMLAVLPQLNKASGISMFQAEATGITHDKIHPRIRQTALSVWGVYSLLTVISTVLLWIGPMNLFDSLCQTFAAVATGGFSTRNAGVGYWQSDYVLITLTAVMFVAGLNFIMIYNTARKGIREIFTNSIFKTFTCVTIIAYMLLAASAVIRHVHPDIDDLLVYPLFHVVSAVTSTGFSINGAEGWGSFALFLTILLMLCGACTGSTSGGIKIDRLMVLRDNAVNEIRKTAFPQRTYVVHLNGNALDHSMVARITAFVTLYLTVIIILTGVITMWGYSMTDSLFMVCSCIGCNGLGYGITGAEGSFAALPDVIKWLLSAVMLIGRLELFTFLVLLIPSFWKR